MFSHSPITRRQQGVLKIILVVFVVLSLTLYFFGSISNHLSTLRLCPLHPPQLTQHADHQPEQQPPDQPQSEQPQLDQPQPDQPQPDQPQPDQPQPDQPQAQTNHTRKFIYPPPTYDFIYQYERNLPQLNLDLPFPEGRSGRYVKFSNQIKDLGWNNCFNEVLMNAHLAYESKRAYVFQEYHWKPDYFPWQPAAGWPWMRTPLNALISGPVAGGLWDPDDHAPRSITEDWFEVVCPPSERRLIHAENVKLAIAREQGDVIFDRWRRVLLEAPERCIEVLPIPTELDAFGQIFDLWLWGTNRILPLWERFRDSPVSRLLGPSTLVRSAVSRNELLFLPRRAGGSRDPYERLMAVHVRRGDYKHACLSLANWNSTYYSWNLLEFLPDSFVPPPGGTLGKNTPENIEAYLEHCLPTMDSIVQTISNARDAYIHASTTQERVLDAIYILTNDDSEWLTSLKETLGRSGWNTIATSHDLILDQEQIAVHMAVDMDIARQAAVFIGNGWSSLSSNIVHQRLVDGKEPISIRFW